MNRVMAFEVCSELEEDLEFAVRLHSVALPMQRVQLLTAYFVDRGMDVGDTMVLVSAYLAGVEHGLIWTERMLDRAEKAR